MSDNEPHIDLVLTDVNPSLPATEGTGGEVIDAGRSPQEFGAFFLWLLRSGKDEEAARLIGFPDYRD